MNAGGSLVVNAPRCQECGCERGWYGPCPTCGADFPRARFDLWPETGYFETEPKR